MTALRKPHPNDPDTVEGLGRLDGLTVRFWLEAAASVAEGKVEAIVKQWLAHSRFADLDEDAGLTLFAQAMTFAMDVVVFMPSMTGSTGMQRFARQYRAADQMEVTALQALRTARFRLLDLEARVSPELILARDHISGEIVRVVNADASEEGFGYRVAGRICALPGGVASVIGPLIPLDAAALDVVNAFIRPGRGLINAERCAAALYKHVVRHGVPQIHGLNTFPALSEDELEPEFPADGPGMLAEIWSRLQPGVEPPSDDIAEARSSASIPGVIEGLLRTVVARRAKQFRLADAYTLLASIQIETISLRSRVGVGGGSGSLDSLAAAIDRGIADGELTTDVRALFEDLRVRVLARQGTGARTRDGGDDLDRVLQRIRALRAKTIDRGCSEQEALAAADKVAELLDRYGLSLSETELKAQTCEGFGIDTERRRKGAIDECIPAVGAFCDCKVWGEHSPNGTIRYVFFGLPADVEAAHYLYDLVAVAFETETATFKRGEIYADMMTGERRSAVSSFQFGLGAGLRVKLLRLKEERTAASRASSGRDLVPLKASVIEADLEKLGLSFRSEHSKRKKRVMVDAFQAGQAAGHRFEVRPGIASSGSRRARGE